MGEAPALPHTPADSDSHPQTPPSAPLRIFFMGSGDIAVPALAALAANPRFILLGCATQPDRPVGRRRVMTPTPVGQWCADHQVPLHKPASVNRPDFVQLISALELDLIVVFAFGQILKDRLLKLPKLGSVNIHASLLPKHRGAAPVTAAILHGDRQTGISIMQMTADLDAGAVYARYPIDLSGRETTPELDLRLATLAAERTGPCIEQIANRDITPQPQADDQATYAPRLSKEDGRLAWTQPAAQIERQVRAYYPWPGAWFSLDTPKGPVRVTITAATVVPGDPNATPGAWLLADQTHGWTVACGHDALRIDRLIPEGRKEMTCVEFLRGRPLQRVQSVTYETTHR